MSQDNINRLQNILQEATSLLSNIVNSGRPTNLEDNPDRKGEEGSYASQSVNSSSPNSAVTNNSNFQGASSFLRNNSRLAIDNEQPSTSMSIRSSVSSRLAEVRSIFQPYNSQNRRNNVRSSGARQNVTVRSRSWEQKVFLLGKFVTCVPDSRTKVILTNQGLGQEIIQLDNLMTSKQVEDSIRHTYSIIGPNCIFELTKSAGAGSRQALVRLSSNLSIPPGSHISSAISKSQIVFIRPLSTIFEESVEEVISDRVSDDEMTTSSLNIAETGEMKTEDVSIDSDKDIVDDFLEAITLYDLRKKIYAENPGVQPIVVQRSFMLESLIGVYKHPRFNLYIEPDVVFVGEMGADGGALHREFFWIGMKSLLNDLFLNKILIFEGERDFKLPNADFGLIQNKIFSTVGKFMVHSAIHTGVAFSGLSKVVSQYVFADDPLDELQVETSINDIPDVDVRNTLEKVKEWNGRAPEAELNSLRELALNSGITFMVSFTDRSYALEEIKRFHVIYKRKAQLDAIRQEFKSSKIYDFLKKNYFLIDSVFPKEADILISADSILNKMQLNSVSTQENHQIFETWRRIVKEKIDSDPKLAKELMKAWTAWPYLPDENLIVKVEDATFSIHACTYEIILPISSTYEFLAMQLDNILSYGVSCFNTI